LELRVAVNDTNLRLVTEKTHEAVLFARLSSCRMFRTAVCSANILSSTCGMTDIFIRFQQNLEFLYRFS